MAEILHHIVQVIVKYLYPITLQRTYALFKFIVHFQSKTKFSK